MASSSGSPISKRSSGRLALPVIAGGTILSYGIAWTLGVPFFVPVLNTLPAFPFLLASLRSGAVGEGVGRMLVWAAAMGASATALAFWQSAETARLFVHASAYEREMFAWVLTGIGAESNPAQFVPTHLLHAVVFASLSLASGSVLSMPFGAVLMNYMGHYVGTLAAHSGRPALTMLLGWHPWSLVRITSFVILGVVLAGPVLSRFGGFRFRLGRHRTIITLALAGLALDVLLKWLLAPLWADLLRNAVGWASGAPVSPGSP